jgi:FkbM family methyltransferase
MIRYIIKSLIKLFGYDLRNIKKFDSADDPYFVLKLLIEPKKVTTIIDGGASIGDISKKLSYMFPKAIVFAVEPYPPFYDTLIKIAAQNNKIRAKKLAFSNINNSSILQINRSKGTNSLLKSSKEGKAIYGNLLERSGEVEVKSQKIDDFIRENSIEQVDLLKLDLQGSELPALLGAANSLSDGRIKCILCEIMLQPHYESQPTAGSILYELMEKYDYSLFNLYNHHHHHGYLCQADALLFHSSIHSSVVKKAQLAFHSHSVVSVNA